MNMIQLLVGMSHWKKRMKKLESVPMYSDEWWAECEDALEFMDPESRKAFFFGFIAIASTM